MKYNSFPGICEESLPLLQPPLQSCNVFYLAVLILCDFIYSFLPTLPSLQDHSNAIVSFLCQFSTLVPLFQVMSPCLVAVLIPGSSSVSLSMPFLLFLPTFLQSLLLLKYFQFKHPLRILQMLWTLSPEECVCRYNLFYLQF